MADLPATPRKESRAREAGLHPLSHRLPWTASLLTLLAGLLLARPRLTRLLDDTAEYLRQISAGRLWFDGALALGTELLAIVCSLLGAAWLVLVLTALIQTRFQVARRLRPSPAPLRQVWSAANLVRTGWRAMGAAVFLAVGTVILYLGWPHFAVASLAGDPGQAIQEAIACLGLGVFVLALLAMADLLIERRLYVHQLQMTPAEMHAERRQTGVSPEIRAQQRKRARGLSNAAQVARQDEVIAVLDTQRRLLAVVAWNPDKWNLPMLSRLLLDWRDDVLSDLRARSIPLVVEPVVARHLCNIDPGQPAPSHILDDLADLLAEHPERLPEH